MAGESSSSSADSYIGSFISLISKHEIRYEGVLYYINTRDSTIGLKGVRSFGTEGRKKGGPEIPPSHKVYEYILFRGSDVKDLQVKPSPPAYAEEQIHNDPAIIQSYYAGSPLGSSSLASVGGNLTASTRSEDTPALISRAYPDALPLNQSGTRSTSGQFQTTQIDGAPSFSTPTSWLAYNGASISISHSPQQPIPLQPPSTMPFPLTAQNLMKDSQIHASTTEGLLNSSEFVSSMPSSISSNFVHPSCSPTPTPGRHISLDTQSSLSVNEFLPSHSASMLANRLTMSSFSSCQDRNNAGAQIVGKDVSDPISSVFPVQPIPYPSLSFLASTSNSLLTPPPSLFTPDQLAQPRQHVLSPIPKLYPEKQDTAVRPPSYNSSSAISTQAPLLQLPISVQQCQQSTSLQCQQPTPQYTEEFDFVAMNDKFKKDEVWGHLGKANQSNKIDGVEDNAIGQNLVNEGHGMVRKIDPKPAYNKDEFFDTISCNSLSHGIRNGQNRFSERMRMDTQTFSNFQHRTHVGYGAGRGDNYRGSYNWGRGYGYSGRGHGGNTPV